MTAKTYLEQHSMLTAKIQRMQDAIEAARSAAAYPGIKLTGMPRSATPRNSTEDKLIKLLTIEERLREIMLKDVETIYDIENTLNMMENQKAAQVLHLRYIKDMPFDAYYGDCITNEMSYSKSHVHRLHRDGLDELQKILDKKET